MKKNRPVLVTYIVDLNFLNSFLLIVSLFPKLTQRFGIAVPALTFSNVTVRIFIILILLTISYGLLKLKRWGYWLMIAYNLFFLLISIVSLFKFTGQAFYSPGLLISILGLSLTFSAARYFTKENKTL
jgi:uncharacterized membrane protein (DUF2068 family)